MRDSVQLLPTICCQSVSAGSTGIKYEFTATTDDAGSVAISEQICCQSIVILRTVCLPDIYIHVFKNFQQYSYTSVINTIIKELYDL